MSTPHLWKRLLIAVLAFGAVGAYAVWHDLESHAALIARPPESHPQITWAACNANARNGGPSTFRPLSDQAAAALITPEAETRSFNSRPYSVGGKIQRALNDYVPTASQLAHFHSARVSDGRTVTEFNPYFRYVDGRDGLSHPSTDDLIQWGAHKWGIPEDWLRAEYVVESFWNGFQLGDETKVSPSWYARYPIQARVSGSLSVYESMGITQLKWIADNSVGAGTEPLRWESTAFNIDYQAAMLRFYYDNPAGARSSWGDAGYAPCQAWNSLGGWYEPYPWKNHGQEQYIAKVQSALKQREWLSAGFVDFSPGSFPPGVKFK